MNLTRRQAVIKMAVLMGATAVGPRLLAADFGKAPDDAGHGFSAAEIALLDEIGDTIIPTTDVPGAKAAGIGAFIAMMLNDCYQPGDQTQVKDGLKKIDASYAARFGGTFVAGDPASRTALLSDLDHESRQPGGPYYFRMLKELTILGYFSSEIGCTQALRFIEVPGRYDGAAPYKKGEHAWFN